MCKKGCVIVVSHLCQIPVLHLAIWLISKAVWLQTNTCPSFNKRHVYTDTHCPRKTLIYTQIYSIKTVYVSVDSVHISEKSKIQKKFRFCIYSLFPSISKYLQVIYPWDRGDSKYGFIHIEMYLTHAGLLWVQILSQKRKMAVMLEVFK